MPAKKRRSKKPHRKEETILWAAGHTHVAGVDEVGKGSWAGPLVAAAVILPMDWRVVGVNDSKVLTQKQRERLFVDITRQAVSWAVAVIPPAYIDQRGIVAANKKAILDSLKRLHVRPDAVLIDAVKVKYGKKPVKSIIDGDAQVISIAAASIVAKVVRDALMTGHHRLLPQYHFHQHKGYGTDEHLALLKKHGLSPIHRRSFQPMKTMARKKAKA